MARIVLVTGVSRYLGGLFARELSQDTSIERILGVDVTPPPHGIGRAEFVRADIRNPMIGRIMSQAGVDTVVHMNVLATPKAGGGRVSQKEINVIGTMQLLAACQKSESVSRLVVKSSSAVYGASPRDPAVFGENMSARANPRSGWGKDSIEVEGYVRGFSRRRPDVEITMLRFANVLGPGIRTAITDYFELPLVPVPMGYDARFQFVHEDDVTRAMVLATTGPSAGIVNVAGDGYLTLGQCLALVGRPFVPVPLNATGAVGGLVKRSGLADFSSDQVALLAYGRGLDTSRMRRVLGLEPEFTTRDAFESFAARVGHALPDPGHAVEAVGTAVGGAVEMATSTLGRLIERIH